MNRAPDTLMELTHHGTPAQPMVGIQFATGAGTPYPQYFFVPRHWHPSVELLHILRGSYQAEINLTEYRLNPGDFCFIGSGALHQLKGLDGDTLHRVLLFDPAILSFSYEDQVQAQLIRPFQAQELSLPTVVCPQSPHYALCSEFVSALMETALERPEDWYFRCKLMLLDFLHALHGQGGLSQAKNQLTPAEREQIHRFKTLVVYMQQHFAERITLEDLAQVAQCSNQYLCRFFKRFSGKPPIEYLISLRLKQAAVLLRQTNRSVLEIGLDCGFDNVSYFIRKFKAATGQTPLQYRIAECSHKTASPG